MKTIDSIEELNQENIPLYVDEVWEALSENLYDKFTAMNIIVDHFEDEINNGEQVIREKVEEIFRLVTNQGEELLSTKLNRQKCQWLLEVFFTNHLVPTPIDGSHYKIPNEFWNTPLGVAMKEILYPDLSKEAETYIPISAKEAADMLGVSTVYVQKIAAEQFDGKKLTSGWVVNLRRVLDYKDGGTGKDMIVTIEYGISRDRYNDYLIETGKSTELIGKFETTLSSLSPEIRKQLVEALTYFRSCVVKETSTSMKVMLVGDERDYLDPVDMPWVEKYTLDKNAGISSVFLNDHNVEDYLSKFLDWHKLRSLRLQDAAREDEERLDQQLHEETINEMQNAQKEIEEKQNWIKQYGSSYLQKLFTLNFAYENQYVIERAAQEFPNYQIDFQIHWFRFRKNNSPTEVILDELIRIQELKNETNAAFASQASMIYYEDGDYAHGYEGVVITKYLGKYTLVGDFSIHEDELPY